MAGRRRQPLSTFRHLFRCHLTAVMKVLVNSLGAAIAKAQYATAPTPLTRSSVSSLISKPMMAFVASAVAIGRARGRGGPVGGRIEGVEVDAAAWLAAPDSPKSGQVRELPNACYFCT